MPCFGRDIHLPKWQGFWDRILLGLRGQLGKVMTCEQWRASNGARKTFQINLLPQSKRGLPNHAGHRKVGKL